MNEHESQGRTAGEAETRRPYAKPDVAWEQPFETQAGLASACGKIAGTGEPCDSSPAS